MKQEKHPQCYVVAGPNGAEVCDHTLCLDNTGEQIVSIFEKRFGQPIKIHDIERFSILQGVLKNE